MSDWVEHPDGYEVKIEPPRVGGPGWIAPGKVTVREAIPPGRFEFHRQTWGREGEWRTSATYYLDAVTAHGVEFNLDEVEFYSLKSEFNGCVFRQTPAVTTRNRKRYQHSLSGGMLGWRERSTYRDCVFDHVDFGGRGGGFYPGDVAFEGCTFRNCAFRQFRADQADFIDCTFVGTVHSARFYGLAQHARGGPRHNTFTGNDFSRAKLRRVEFRGGIDLRTNRLPEGVEYLHVENFRAKAERARVVMASWPDDERERAEFLLRLYEEEEVDTLFGWRGSLAGTDSPLWPLLESLADQSRNPGTAPA